MKKNEFLLVVIFPYKSFAIYENDTLRIKKHISVTNSEAAKLISMKIRSNILHGILT
jgi:hypothetical protein